MNLKEPEIKMNLLELVTIGDYHYSLEFNGVLIMIVGHIPIKQRNRKIIIKWERVCDGWMKNCEYLYFDCEGKLILKDTDKSALSIYSNQLSLLKCQMPIVHAYIVVRLIDSMYKQPIHKLWEFPERIRNMENPNDINNLLYLRLFGR